jgi:hypothetical protein
MSTPPGGVAVNMHMSAECHVGSEGGRKSISAATYIGLAGALEVPAVSVAVSHSLPAAQAGSCNVQLPMLVVRPAIPTLDRAPSGESTRTSAFGLPVGAPKL